jgi:SH3-like domain-containing protein
LPAAIRMAALTLLVVLTSCSSRASHQPSAGVAYAGPATLNIRKDLASKSANVGSVHHGEKLDVLETRRRFAKVRTQQGIEGWTDSTYLLTPQQMDDLRRLSDSASKLPSQGTATAFDTLNIHADPSRQSPSFFQIAEATAVEVIGHRIAPRSSAAPPALVRRISPVKKSTKSSKRAPLVLPLPPVPAPPSNWQALSRPRITDLPGYRPPEPKPVPIDDWSLIRTKDGNVGWVLSRMLQMSIPDEVAQYAEGHRITAYLALGEVKDKDNDAIMHNWLWTTTSSTQLPYEFDSFRVFVWSTRRHHYETAYIERNVKGHYPVTTEDRPGDDGKAFSLVLEDKDGKLYRRTYAFSGYHVRMLSKVQYQPADPLPEVHTSRSFDPLPTASVPSTAWSSRFKDKLRQWKRKLF